VVLRAAVLPEAAARKAAVGPLPVAQPEARDSPAEAQAVEALAVAADLRAAHRTPAVATLAAVRAVIPLLAVPAAVAAAQDLKAAVSRAAAAVA
jgi:hypothetical protein